MNRTEKEQLVEQLHEELKAAPHVVLVDFRGLSVPAATEFRRKVRAAGSKYRVVKNRLALRAAKDTPLEKLDAQFVGTTGIAWTGDDPVVMAKALVDFAKEFPALKFKAGVVAGERRAGRRRGEGPEHDAELARAALEPAGPPAGAGHQAGPSARRPRPPRWPRSSKHARKRSRKTSGGCKPLAWDVGF